MKLEIEVSDETIENLLEASRTHYWQKGPIELVPGAEPWFVGAKVCEGETGEWFTLDFRRGVELAITKPIVFLHMDSEAGDAFVQLCAFGEVRYG